MSWSQSLIRISNHQVETLQKRLRKVDDRRDAIVCAAALIDQEEAVEVESARRDASTGWYLIGFRAACRARRFELAAERASLDLEALGVRDALAEAFEAQKKYEHVAEAAAATLARDVSRRESAALDELGRRRRALA